MYFSYVIAEINRLFSEIFAQKLGIDCNIMAAIWMLRWKFTKWIWKQQIFELQRLLPNMAFTYKYGNTSPNNKIESEIAYNTTATLDKLSCTDFVDFGQCQERFGRFSWTKKDSKNLDIKLKVFKREDKNAGFQLRQNLLMGEADFNQFIWQGNQLVLAADNFLREQNLSPVFHSTLSKDIKTWRSNWRWLTLWIAQTEWFVWHCWDTRRTTQRLPTLKSVYSDGRSRKKIFSKLFCQL